MPLGQLGDHPAAGVAGQGLGERGQVGDVVEDVVADDHVGRADPAGHLRPAALDPSAGTPRRPAAARKDATMAGDSSTATSRPAVPASRSPPPPAPTSRTVPPAGRSRAASRFDGVAGRDPARAARDRNSPTGKPHGDSGAEARISSGIAQPSSCVRHRPGRRVPGRP